MNERALSSESTTIDERAETTERTMRAKRANPRRENQNQPASQNY